MTLLMFFCLQPTWFKVVQYYILVTIAWSTFRLAHYGIGHSSKLLCHMARKNPWVSTFSLY